MGFGPKIVKDWHGGSAAKTSVMFFGYNLYTSYGTFSENEEIYRRYMTQFDGVSARLFELSREGEVQLLYLDRSLVERRVVAFRFTSESAYNAHRKELVSIGDALGRGVWEPLRNDRQRTEWQSHLPQTTPTVSVQ